MIKKLLFLFVQWTWGLPQNIAGLVLYLINVRASHFVYNNCRGTVWDRPSGLSLGMFIFVWNGADERVVAHEYGHSLQSMILGPLYLLLIGIPSFIWCTNPAARKKWSAEEKAYYSFLPERWADRLGKAYNTVANDTRR